MRIGVIPENILDRLVLLSGTSPVPIAHTHLNFMMARTIMAAANAGIFESLSKGALSADEVARACKTHPVATNKLLHTLIHLDYVRRRSEKFCLTDLAKKWLLKDSATSLHRNMKFSYVEWNIAEHIDTYLKTGEAMDIHTAFNAEDWSLYQHAMAELGNIGAPMIARQVPVPKHARTLLDIGGSHGYNSAAICARHKDLKAVVLDLPQALASRGPASHSNVSFVEGDIRTYDIGEEQWDVILMANLVHHFDDQTNRMLIGKIARALRTNGLYVVLDFLRREKPAGGDHVGALLDMYFSVTSQSSTFSLNTIRQWQSESGLEPQRARWMRLIPHYGLQVGVKK